MFRVRSPLAAPLLTCREHAFSPTQEPYDDDDRARQLALGTMMLRKHRAKELVDAAYNRFSWNDDADLPDWFVDDEKRHHRPQVPLPPALVEQMKNKFMSLATKPIKKVAEARARKRKRATQRLANAKKKATAMAANPGELPRPARPPFVFSVVFCVFDVVLPKVGMSVQIKRGFSIWMDGC